MAKSRPSQKPNQRLNSITRTAQAYGPNPYFWRTQIWAGRIPVVKVGNKQFLDAKDVEKFIEKHKSYTAE